ncbi:hypothetical protein Taro_056809 [Colocasia esculenta]|uniref:Uncharacterized protein n=1 Tax=Colocasia esculenta TaxID=4460 RepID=A0A843XXM0_COLES|nr:hypothetical protein [Colocasia esculenta]
MEEAPSQGEQSILEPEVSKSVAEGHLEKVVLEEAPAQGEQESVDLPAPIQGEQQGKQKRVAHKRPRKSHRKVNLKPIMALLNAQGEVLSSVQTSVQGITSNQASTSSDLSSIRNAMRWFNKEMSDMKQLLANLSKSSGVPPAPTQSSPATVPRPPGPPVQASGPPGPSGQASGSSGPSSIVREVKGKEPMAATSAPDTSNLATPVLSSPTSPSTAPPAPPTIKHPVSRTQPSFSLTSSQPSFSPTPSHTSGPSSFSPSSPLSQPTQVQPPSSFNPKHLFYRPTPPSSVTFIPEKPPLLGVFDTNLPDDFERNTLSTILFTATHIHRTDPPSHAKKKRKQSSSITISSSLFPPLWYSLTLEPHKRFLYKEYLQKCILSTIYGIPFLTLSEHLNVVLPLTQLSHSQKSKIFEGTEFKTEDQWANVKGNKA